MKYFGFSAILLWEIGWVVVVFFKLILGKLESEILQRALWLFFKSISTHQCCSETPAFISKVKVASRAVTLKRLARHWRDAFPGRGRHSCLQAVHPGLKSDAFFILLWSQEPWDLSLVPWNKEKKDWPTLLSNSEFQRPANWDQDQLPGPGTQGMRVFICSGHWVWQLVSYRRLRVLRTDPSPWRNGAPASLLLGKLTKQNSWGKDPTSSLKIQCLPHHLSFHSLQSSACFSSLPTCV